MKKEELSRYLGKKIRINLKKNTFFSGHIECLSEDSITILDKFDNLVTIDYSDISFILQVKDREERQ